jgi:redox-sensitive bicupin YhaK (pirin superfamily)
MSAGTGVVHSEFNASAKDPVHFLQIWITPSEEDLEPSYQQISFKAEEKEGRLRLLAGPDPAPGSARIHQDARIYACVLANGEQLDRPVGSGRHAWVQVAEGRLKVNGVELETGDGVAVSGEKALHFSGNRAGAEFLLFDLA